jgi:protein CpxP
VNPFGNDPLPAPAGNNLQRFSGVRQQFRNVLAPQWARRFATFITHKEKDMFESRKNKLIAVLAVAGLLGAGALAWAQAPGPGHHGGDLDGMGPMGHMESVHKKLNLNAQQEELWKKAQAESREAFKNMRASGREVREKMRAEIDKPGADLKQFVQLGDQMREKLRVQMDARRTQTREAWFKAYDALDASQKEQVRLAIKDGMDHAGRGGHMGMRGHRGQGPDQGPGPH